MDNFWENIYYAAGLTAASLVIIAIGVVVLAYCALERNRLLKRRTRAQEIIDEMQYIRRKK